MSSPIQIAEQFFLDSGIKFRHADDAVEVTFYGYPITERYRIVYMANADAVLISSHGVVYPSAQQEEAIMRKLLIWNHDSMGACWSFDKDTRGVCADSTLYLGGLPLSVTQFDRHFNGLVSQVRGKLVELLRLTVNGEETALDANLKAQLQQILELRGNSPLDKYEDESAGESRSEGDIH